jgi:heme oxygenase
VTALSSRLRSETKEAHTAAERSGIMRALLRGSIDRASYVALLANLAALYAALESIIDRHCDDPVFAPFDFAALRRLPSLRHDLARLSDDAGATVALEPATLAYVAHLHALEQNAPPLVIAHAYLRYLGDMYGGQIIKAIVERTVAAGVPDATTFYNFAAIADLETFKTAFRDSVDGLATQPSDVEAMIREAQCGYALHSQLFTELDARPRAAPAD